MIQCGKAAEASCEAQREEEAHYYGQSTDELLALSLSKAHVETKKALEALATRLVELEQAAIRLRGREAA